MTSSNTTKKKRRARPEQSIAQTKHGNAFRGRVTPEYRTWQNITDRCGNPSNSRYASYGGRGIVVCERWRLSVENFLADMGKRPDGSGMSIDRIDNDRGYSCGKCDDCIARGESANCQWATPTMQRRNQHRTKLTKDGAVEIRCRRLAGEALLALATEFGVSIHTVCDIAKGRTWC